MVHSDCTIKCICPTLMALLARSPLLQDPEAPPASAPSSAAPGSLRHQVVAPQGPKPFFPHHRPLAGSQHSKAPPKVSFGGRMRFCNQPAVVSQPQSMCCELTAP